MELNKIIVATDYKHLQILEITDSGGYHQEPDWAFSIGRNSSGLIAFTYITA